MDAEEEVENKNKLDEQEEKAVEVTVRSRKITKMPQDSQSRLPLELQDIEQKAE